MVKTFFTITTSEKMCTFLYFFLCFQNYEMKNSVTWNLWIELEKKLGHGHVRICLTQNWSIPIVICIKHRLEKIPSNPGHPTMHFFSCILCVLRLYTQQNSYFICHRLSTVTTQSLTKHRRYPVTQVIPRCISSFFACVSVEVISQQNPYFISHRLSTVTTQSPTKHRRYQVTQVIP